MGTGQQGRCRVHGVVNKGQSTVDDVAERQPVRGGVGRRHLGVVVHERSTQLVYIGTLSVDLSPGSDALDRIIVIEHSIPRGQG
jgi:hypothetical protein